MTILPRFNFYDRHNRPTQSADDVVYIHVLCPCQKTLCLMTTKRDYETDKVFFRHWNGKITCPSIEESFACGPPCQCHFRIRNGKYKIEA